METNKYLIAKARKGIDRDQEDFQQEGTEQYEVLQIIPQITKLQLTITVQSPLILINQSFNVKEKCSPRKH